MEKWTISDVNGERVGGSIGYKGTLNEKCYSSSKLMGLTELLIGVRKGSEDSVNVVAACSSHSLETAYILSILKVVICIT